MPRFRELDALNTICFKGLISNAALQSLDQSQLTTRVKPCSRGSLHTYLGDLLSTYTHMLPLLTYHDTETLQHDLTPSIKHTYRKRCLNTTRPHHNSTSQPVAYTHYAGPLQNTSPHTTTHPYLDPPNASHFARMLSL